MRAPDFMKPKHTIITLGIILLNLSIADASDNTDELCSDREAVERIYYNHRTGEKPPFEQTLARDEIKNLVRTELRKEAALHKSYAVNITPAMVEAEVQRIHRNTRAPEMLAELKAALGNDDARFARAVAR